MTRRHCRRNRIGDGRAVCCLRLVRRLPARLSLMIVTADSGPQLAVLGDLLTGIGIAGVVLRGFLFAKLASCSRTRRLLRVGRIGM